MKSEPLTQCVGIDATSGLDNGESLMILAR